MGIDSIEPRPETQTETSLMLMTSPHSIDAGFAIEVCQTPLPSRVEPGSQDYHVHGYSIIP